MDVKAKRGIITQKNKKHIIDHRRQKNDWICIKYNILDIYGLFEIIKNIIYINTYTKFKSDGIHVIIAVKNQEEKIEGFLRSILFKILYGREEYLKNIIVADLESTDNTKEIAKKLAKDYEILKVISWKECKDIMDSINESTSK